MSKEKSRRYRLRLSSVRLFGTCHICVLFGEFIIFVFLEMNLVLFGVFCLGDVPLYRL
jgi:hypothetical protein